jgi:hypothetical protein
MMRCSSCPNLASRSNVVSILSGIPLSNCIGVAFSSHPLSAEGRCAKEVHLGDVLDGRAKERRLSRSETARSERMSETARLVRRDRPRMLVSQCDELAG